MNPDLERVRAAIAQMRCDVQNKHDGELAKRGFWPDRNFQPTDEQYARAALSALLPPSEEMVSAAADVLNINFGRIVTHEKLAAKVITAAIQSILKEGEGT